MKFLTLLTAVLALSLPLQAEKVIQKCKDRTLVPQAPNQGFYVFEKIAKNYRNKDVVFKMDIKL